MAAVEASSLADLSALASDPPLSPFDHLPIPHQELVLYIAKVPGTRDVFLSPLKPREKVVTAEDIQSSLYYFHVHGPEDEYLLNELAEETLLSHGAEHRTDGEAHERSSRPPLPERPVVARHPLPPLPPEARNSEQPTLPDEPLPPYPLDAGPHALPSLDASGQSSEPKKAHKIGRKPVSAPALVQQQNVASLQNGGFAHDLPPVPPRHQVPVGTTLRKENIQLHTLSATNTAENRASKAAGFELHQSESQQVNSSYRSEQITNNSHSVRRKRISQVSAERNVPHPHLLSTSPPKNESYFRPSRTSDFQITVIRRDPSSGQQWNVATIRDPPVVEVTSPSDRESETVRATRRKGQPLYLEVTTVGYGKFTDQPMHSGTGPHSVGTASAIRGLEEPFTRRLWMEGSVFEQQAKHRKSYSAENIHPPPLPARPIPSIARRSIDLSNPNTNASFGPSEPYHPTTHSLTMDPAKQRSKTKGYTFLSPWNTRCEFSAGIGQTLRCRHALSYPTQGGLAPSPAVMPDPIQVSELRFNLPGGGQAQSSATSSSPPKQGKDSRHRRFLHLRKGLPESPGAELIDLSLGQERAGGGFSGKQAKLGKLIISPEGCKMLDLLVAANMGLWWRAYGKE